MAHEVFIDTSGFYALLVKRDDRHRQASDLMRDAARKRLFFVTTDYVLDETATLLQARGHIRLVNPFFASVFESRVCRTIWTDADRFGHAKSLFLKRLGQGWSFTDCVNLVVMKELRLREVLSKDSRFAQAGFTVWNCHVLFMTPRSFKELDNSRLVAQVTLSKEERVMSTATVRIPENQRDILKVINRLIIVPTSVIPAEAKRRAGIQ